MKLTKTQTIKAIRFHAYGGADVLHYEDAPRPEPEAGEVLIKVHAAAVNPVDWKIRAGHFPAQTELPITPGSDVAGVIEAIGPEVGGLRVGDAVYGAIGSGAYAQYAVAKAGLLARKPERLDFIQAASVPLAAMTAWQALFDHGGLGRGQTVLIHAGAGGVGMFAIQLAKWRGARVLATGSARSVEFLRHLGADEVIDYEHERFEDIARDVDLVLDTLGGEAQERSWAVLAPGGMLVSLVQPPSQARAKELGVRAEIFRMEPSTALLVDIAELVSAGRLHTQIAQVFPLSRASEAQLLSETGHVHGKIVLEVD